MLVNLLANAYRYGGRHMQVEATRSPEGVLLVVSDDGAGARRSWLKGCSRGSAARQVTATGLGSGCQLCRG